MVFVFYNTLRDQIKHQDSKIKPVKVNGQKLILRFRFHYAFA